MKVGVIGLGGMGLHHAGDLRALDLVTEVIGCDVVEAMRRRAEGKGIRTVKDIEALLAEKPDAIVVATQATTHAPIIRRCLEAGVPVLTEKPMTTDVKEGRKLVALAEKKGLHFQVGFEMPYNGSIIGMNDIVARGIIGRPRYATLVQLCGHRFTRARNGGVFYEKLCHEIDLFRRLFGEPERVMAIAGPQVMKGCDVADNVVACLRFPGGELGSITYLTTRSAQLGGTSDHGDRGHFFELVLTCTNGSVTYDAWTETLEVVRFNHREDRKAELVESINFAERYGKGEYNIADEDRDFLERTRDGKPLRFPASDAQVTMEWVERAERSLAEGGRWVAKDE